ncbi:MAG: putative 2-dehydropantoate 2-reductase [Cyanobacteria bacterium J06573_11]
MSALSYAIIGTGAIGGFYGARLQQAGCDVHFLLRSDYRHVRQSGLKVDSIDGDFVLPQVQAYDNPAALPPVDVAVVALKTTRNHQLCELLPPVKPGGAILSLQNGFGVEGAIAHHLTQKKLPVPAILGGLCFICSNKVGPGHFRHLDYGRILFGAHQETQQPCLPTTLMKTIVADFTRASIEVSTTDDLPMARWQKLVWNVPFNGLSVVLNATTEAMMADQGVRSLITALMQEVVTLANAWGEKHSPGARRQLSSDIITKMLTHTETMPPYRTSMKIDFDESRPLEIETILGNPIREAHRLAVPVPNMQMLYQQLSFLMSENCSK